MIKRIIIAIAAIAIINTNVYGATAYDQLVAKTLNIVANYTDAQKQNAYALVYADLLGHGDDGNFAIKSCHDTSDKKSTRIACMMAMLLVIENNK